MADIEPTNPINISDKLDEMKLMVHHPSLMVESHYNMISDMTDGRVKTLTASNPVAYNLEQQALSTVFLIQETVLETRKLYPVNANTEEDLYRHMSDKDFLNRFSTPSTAKVMFYVMYNDFLTKGYFDPVTEDRIFKIPRYFKIEIAGTIFTTMAPVIIRRTKQGVVDVRYEGGLNDSIFPVSQGYIHYDVVEERGDKEETQSLEPASGQGERYLTFELTLPEIEVTRKNVTVEQSGFLTGDVAFNPDRKFYYVRVFHSSDRVNWEEMVTTHTEEVFDIRTPTCMVKVLQEQGIVKYYIPPAFVHSGQIKGNLRFVIYTTKGPININYDEFQLNQYSGSYSDIFPATEMDVTSEPINLLRPYTFIRGRVIGGRPAKTFAELKFDVINNNLIPNIPVTPVNIENSLRGSDLTPISNYDVVTDREFLVKTKIPSNISKYGITRMSLDMIEYKTSMERLRENKNGLILINNDVVVLPQNTIFQSSVEQGLRILTKDEANALTGLTGQALVTEVNRNNYMGLYYHYVLDTTGVTTQLRAYDISKPRIVSSIFEDYNNTVGLAASTTSLLSKMTKVSTGYRIDFLTTLTTFNSAYSVYNITPCLVYRTDTGNKYFIEGKLHIDAANNPVFSCFIDSDAYITADNRIVVHNFKDHNGQKISIDIGLTQDLELIFFTDSFSPDFVPSEMDNIIKATYLAGNYAVITLERHKIEFGLRLERLFSRVHTATGGGHYLKYKDTVYKTYDTDVYDADYNIIHHKGDFILDEEGEKMVLHEVGDVVLDEDLKPILDTTEDLARYLNLLLIDYKAVLADGKLTNEYKDHVRQTINTLVLNNMVEFQQDIYNRTEAYLTVPNGLTDITARADGVYGYMSSSQSFKFYVHVEKRVYDDITTRRSIETIVRETLDTYLTGNTTLSRIELLDAIFVKIRPFVLSIRLHKFTELDGEYIKIESNNAEISIRKKLRSTPDGYDIEDDVSFNFVLER